MRWLITLAAKLAHLWYPDVSVDVLVHQAWVESRYTLAVRNGTHCGPWQVSARSAQGTSCPDLMNPFVGAFHAARLLHWAHQHFPGREIDWYMGRL